MEGGGRVEGGGWRVVEEVEGRHTSWKEQQTQ
jgi:hypothetical protein